MEIARIFLYVFIIVPFLFSEGFADEGIDWEVYYYLKYATNASGAWETYVLSSLYSSDGDELFAPVSITIDPNGRAHIVYSFFNFTYATNASGQWSWPFGQVGGKTVGESSIALDSLNNVHTIFYSLSSNELVYATNSSGNWEAFSIENVGNSRHASIAVDYDDKLYISFLSELDSNLKCATNATGNWEIYTVDSNEMAGEYNSIAIDSNGGIHISYCDSSKYNLKYATNSLGEWQTFVIDEGDYTGFDTSIAIDSEDKVHISYIDCLNYKLNYATNKTGEWQTFIIDDFINCEESSTSIALDSKDNVYIAYSRWDLLTYATNSSGEWQTIIVDLPGGAGGFDVYTKLWASIDLDPLDRIHIAYIIPYFKEIWYDDDDDDYVDGEWEKDEPEWPIYDVVHGCACEI